MVEQLQRIITPAVEAMGFELYGCEFHTHANRNVLIVFVDGPKGVTLDDCTRISRQIGAVLDVEDPIGSRYELEVSSPGIDRPLFSVLHFQRVVGQKIKIRLRRPQNNQRNFVGILKAMVDNQVTLLLEDGKELGALFAEIEKAKLISDL